MSIPLVILAGPTGIGKTEVALELAERLHAEIVGADSMQIYRFMDIGTAKPTMEERSRVPHHLIDIRNPDEEYSAADYARDATRVICDIDARGKLPLLVGGTGLYIQAVVYGIFEGPGRDETYREHLRELAEEYGNLALYQKLETLDPLSAHRLHPNDLVRVIRALEIFHLTGIPISAYQATATTPLAAFTPCFLGLTTEREILYDRIETRVDAMIETGLVEEVQGLLQQGYHAELNAMKSLGYKEIVAFLQGQTDLPTAITQIKRDSRRYAKRQLTWFRKYQNVLWVHRTPDMSSDQIVARCLEHIEMWRANL
ncbi:tRNA dimethylallyltransferase [Candidatus Vecturithrix granuli]|uniref:tRNA dimethylallyltransferase n=1 Tax=Vecturithrix granuli TaxID=1499967 RepID=A0A0S6WA18_VECG1|nr:tRNA dimethylallyltransferase [Candidatus Vecturithrix granuli]